MDCVDTYMPRLYELFKTAVLDSEEQGRRILAAVKSDLSNYHATRLSFAGITDVTPACADAFLGPLVRQYGITQLREKVAIDGASYPVKAILMEATERAFAFQTDAASEWIYPPDPPEQAPAAPEERIKEEYCGPPAPQPPEKGKIKTLLMETVKSVLG